MRIKNLPSIESMNGSQDALVIEQTDGSEDKSRKVSPAQIKQYVLGNSIDDIYSVMGQMGAKNLIPYPYYRPNHYEINGITYDVSSDGVITMQTGTSTAEADYHMWHRSNADTSFHLDKGTYILSGCDTNAPGGVSLIINGKAKNGNDKNVATQNSRYPDGVEFTIDDTFDLDRFGVLIYCSSGVTISSALTFKPMIRFVSDINDDTYQPYAKTNRQLTEVIGDLSQTGLTGDSVAEQLTTAKGQIATKVEGLVYPREDHTSLTARMDSITAQRKSGAYIMYCSSVNPDFSTIGYCMAIGFTIYGSVSAIVAVNTQTGEIWTNGNTSQNAGDWRGWRKIN